MKKIYHLSSCNTCQRIIKELNLPKDFEFQDIKENALTESQLQELHSITGNYESLFSKRAQLYKKYKLKERNLQETDFKKYLLEHYTFLKRPVILFKDEIFIGNSKKTVEAAKSAIHD